MKLRKSNHNILMYLAKNTGMKAIPEFNSKHNFMCYLPEMDVFIYVRKKGDIYDISKLAASIGLLDRKRKNSWCVEKFSNLDQKVIQEYIKHNGAYTNLERVILMKEFKTKREVKEPIDDNTKFFTHCKDIIKDDAGYHFEPSAWIDNGYLYSYHSVDELWNPEIYYRSCFVCPHSRWDGREYTCDIATNINRASQSFIEECKKNNINPEHIRTASHYIVECQAFDEVKELNIIRNMKEMIDFMYKTFNMLGGWDGVCPFYGFEIPYDWDNDEAKCTIYEYYKNGGTFDRIPKEDEFPVVIYFDYNCKKSDDLKWISLKGEKL